MVPFNNQMMFVRPGRRNYPALPIYATFFTDSEGRFSLRLPSAGVFTVITREKGESREHVYLRGKEEERRVWLETPAFLIDTHGCTAETPTVHVRGNGRPPGAAAAAGVGSGSQEEVAVSEGLEDALFVSDQRDPTLPTTHTRDFILQK